MRKHPVTMNADAVASTLDPNDGLKGPARGQRAVPYADSIWAELRRSAMLTLSCVLPTS